MQYLEALDVFEVTAAALLRTERSNMHRNSSHVLVCTSDNVHVELPGTSEKLKESAFVAARYP